MYRFRSSLNIKSFVNGTPSLTKRPCRSFSTGICFDLTEDQIAIRDLARNFAKEHLIPFARQWDTTGEFPQKQINKAHEMGLLNAHIPKEYGGLGLGVVDSCIICEELSYGCTGFTTAVMVNDVAQLPIIIAGTEAQKRKYLGRCIESPIIASFCVTEPSAGSDVANIRTKAVKKGDKWILDGEKMWISNAGPSNWLFVLAKTDSTAKPGNAMTGFVVEADWPGVIKGRKEWNMGQRCSDTRGVSFQSVEIPDSNRIGEVGQGFKIVMSAFDCSRPMVAAEGVGLARRAHDEALRYSLQRKTFGTEIINHQAVAMMIADMATGIEASRLLMYKAAAEADAGKRNSYMASLAKTMAADVANKAAADAVQILGGNGYNSEYPVEMLMRDAKILQIYEGTAQIQRTIIAKELKKRFS